MQFLATQSSADFSPWMLLWLLQFTCLASVLATPEHIVKIEEKLWGTNADGYIILRTETDNLGSYFSSRTRQFLDEYSKNADAEHYETAIGKRINSTLLLDVTTSLDPEAKDLKTDAKKKINSQNSSLQLADMLLKFPDPFHTWDESSVGKLEINQQGGISYGRLNILWGGTVIQKTFENRHPELDWTLDEVVEDLNCLYIKVSKRSPDEISETRIICIPPRRTMNTRAHLRLQPLYLTVGPYPTLQEARSHAAALVKKCMDANFRSFEPEIWSLYDGTNKSSFIIADPNTMKHVEGTRFLDLKQVLGIELVPRSSDRFVERFAID